MRLSLKTKLTLGTSLLVLAVVAVVSGLYLGRLMRQTLRQANDNAFFIAQQVYSACSNALKAANERGDTPSSLNPADVRDYVRRAFDNSSNLNSLIESDVGISPTIYEITISDQNGIVLLSSDSSLRDQKIAARPPISSLVRAGFFQQLRELYGPPQIYEFSYPFNLGTSPFGDIRISFSSALIRGEISPGLQSAGIWALGAVLLSTLCAFVFSRVTLGPIERISAQLDRISEGQFDAGPAVVRGDELGAVSTKIVGIGKQLRDVREIFSTLRENLDQVMSGVGDGLLLFNSEGRAVLVSPSVEKFLDRSPEDLRGRRISEIFPARHPLRGVLQIQGDEILPAEGRELTLERKDGPQRVGVNVQVIREHGARMGTLVSLRDVESIERIGSQLQVSERLAALGRVTAGVAHEVKNPLNSMRLWLEVLKANMPVDPEPQQAVKMLDSEIDRLDRAVKTFLNFTKPVEISLEETALPVLLADVLDAARPSILKAGLTLHANLPEAFPAVLLDHQLIHQAVLNLLLNACDFTGPGGAITLSLRRTGDYAVIEVQDSGKGISPEDQKKIFQLFFTTRPGGTGIGLANTFRFVQLHNGRIDFESETGRGTTFRIELPLGRAADAPAAKVRDLSQPFAAEKR
ncbi:MAG TPA: ATP-binding protein [Candidatus Acidoferrales bacterium]|jgi:PAS domain S-box-containing protein|nr:ATP-binding protein [Candidatus Acidoferrales bacterium]